MRRTRGNEYTEREEMNRERQEAETKKSKAMLEYIAIMDYPEIFDEEEEEDNE